MQPIVADTNNIAFCGLYCGACGRYRRGRCPGCRENEKATWCKVRACCLEHGHASCADCTEHADPADCRKLNNFMAKVLGVLFNSNRQACLKMIKDKGYDDFAIYMTRNKVQSLPRG